MGLSSLPAPSEGVLCVVLVNTALSISMFKGIVRSILNVISIRPSSPPSPPTSSLETTTEHVGFCPSRNYIEELKNQMPTSRYKTLNICEKNKSYHDCCSVCLTKFEPESEISKLDCGHLFHKTCLNKWIDYGNITCPMCRTLLVTGEDGISCFW